MNRKKNTDELVTESPPINASERVQPLFFVILATKGATSKKKKSFSFDILLFCLSFLYKYVVYSDEMT
jgi:hypothetical protein